MRISVPALRILKVFLESPRKARSGAELSRLTAVTSSTMAPLLLRLEREGWLHGEWEDVDPIKAGRPRRHLYRLTALGKERAQAALASVQIN